MHLVTRNPYTYLVIITALFGAGSLALADTVHTGGQATGTTYYAGQRLIDENGKFHSSATVDPTITTGPKVIQPKVSDPLNTLSKTGFGFKKANHLKFTGVGVGRSCAAGDTTVTEYQLPSGFYPSTIEALSVTVQEVFQDDHRLREIQITDDRLVLHYILPARLFGVIPINYVLLVEADAPTMTIHLVAPSWLKWATHGEQIVDASFAETVPRLLTTSMVNSIPVTEKIQRHAKLIEVISRSMYGAEVFPYPSSIWFCYILPYLAFIIIGCIGLFVYLWFVIRSYRRRRRVKHIVDYHIHKKSHGDTSHTDEHDEELPTVGRVGGGATENTSEIVFGNTRVIFENKKDTFNRE